MYVFEINKPSYRVAKAEKLPKLIKIKT